MSSEYGNDFITITDEDGNEIELEHLDTVEYEGVTYMAFLPADFPSECDGGAETEEADGLVILKTIEENGEELLSTLDTEEELEAVYNLFMERLFEEPDDGGDLDN